MKVVWKTGFRASVPAQVAYDTIHGLYQQGKKSAKDLVDASRPETAPLHKMFEWDDTVAAEKYRENQGREIIRHIIEIPDTEEEKQTMPIVRAFFQIDEATNDYEPTYVIMRDDEKRERLLKIAKAELKSFRIKYSALQELAKVFSAIDELSGEQETKA